MSKVTVSEVLFLFAMLNLIVGALMYAEAIGLNDRGRVRWNNGRPDPSMRWPFAFNFLLGMGSVLCAAMLKDDTDKVQTTPDAVEQAGAPLYLGLGWTCAGIVFWVWRIYTLIPELGVKQYALVFYMIDIVMCGGVAGFIFSRLPSRRRTPTQPAPSTAEAQAKKDD